jgi:two-component system sensor histidine kinase MprB
VTGVRARWRRLTLRSRLSLLAAGAVAVAVVAVAGLAWIAVQAELYRQLDNQLEIDAQALAGQDPVPVPDLHDPPWAPDAPGAPPWAGRGHGDYGRHDIGPRWQVIDRTGGTGRVAPVLPVTMGAREVATGVAPPYREDVSIGPVRYRMLTVPATGNGGGAVQVAVARDSIDGTLRALGVLLIIGCAAGVAGAGLLGRQVARAGLAPVERLTGAVEQVAATQDLKEAIPVTGDDEIARLARSVNAMLAALEESRTQQRMLVEDAGHELRTPLTSLRTNIELLIRSESSGRALAPDDRARLLRDLEAQVVELAQLTGELVELARQDASPDPVEEVDLADVVGAAVQRARVRAPGVRFSTDLGAAPVSGQPAALERMALNLLDNAAKWSPDGGTVQIGLRADTDIAVLTVADAGPGIDADDVPHVFERFYRATAARAMPGSGLGLAIVAQTVARHRGTVTVGRSEAGGALLTVRLPFSSDS